MKTMAHRDYSILDKSSDHQSLINKPLVVFEKRAKHNNVINKIRKFTRTQGQPRNSSSRSDENQTFSENFVSRTKDLYKDVKKRFAVFHSTIDIINSSTMITPYETSNLNSANISSKLIDNSSSHTSKLRRYASDESISTSESGCGSSVKTSSLSTDSNRSSICTVDDFTNTGPTFKGPFIGHGVALIDCIPCPYDKDALTFKKGDIVNIIAKNDSGTWIGMTNGKIGHFKFINVEEINSQNQSNNHSGVSGNQEGPMVIYYENIITNFLTNVNSYFENSLKLLFKLIGLDKYGYFNLLQEKGFHSLSSLININNQSILEMIGITDREHQQLIMTIASIIRKLQPKSFKLDINDLENNMSSITLKSNQNTSRSASNIGDYPKDYLKISSYCNYIDDFEDQTKTKTPNVLSQNEAILVHQLFKPEKKEKEDITNEHITMVQSNNEILDDDDDDDDVDDVDDDVDDGDDDNGEEDNDYDNDSCVGNACNEARKGIDKNYKGSLDTNILVKKLEHGYQFNTSKCCDINLNRPISSSRSVFNLKHTENYSTDESYYHQLYPHHHHHHNHHHHHHLYYDTAKKRLKKFLNSNERKSLNSIRIDDKRYTSVNALHLTSKPISPHLLDIITNLLREEGIDLTSEPYSDNSGFCGIPPTLVQRYAEELELDVYDIADTLDYIRLNCLLKKFGKQGIPNDFLADSCTGPGIDFANYENVHNWLVSLGLPMYEKKLRLKGWKSLWNIKEMREDDLVNCGIVNKRHLRALSIAIGVLNVNQHKIGKV